MAPKILIGYYSRTGNTKAMARAITEGAEKEGVKAIIKDVRRIALKELLEVDGIILGGPTYYGTLPSEVKKLLDDSVKYHGKLEGKVGGAFTSSANIGGGNETTILSILQAWLIHGMVIQGDHKGDHYGPVSIGAPSKKAKQACVRYGRRIATLVKDRSA